MPTHSDGCQNGAANDRMRVSRICEVCSTLSREQDVEVLLELSGGPRNVRSLASSLELSESDVSKSLRRLRDSELVLFRTKKTSHVYELIDDHVTFSGTAIIVLACGGRIQIDTAGTTNRRHRK